MTWALVLTTWFMVGGKATDLAIDPVGYYPTAGACHKAIPAVTGRLSSLPGSYKIECVYNGA